MTQPNNHTPKPSLPWFDKINADIANSAGVLAMSQSFAQQAAQLNASMQLATKPFSDVENSGAMQMLKQAQEAANRVSVNFKMYDVNTLEFAGAMRNSMSIGIDPEKWQQLTGLKATIDAVTKLNPPLANKSALTGVGIFIPPKSVIGDNNIPEISQSVIDVQTQMIATLRGLAPAIEQATKHLTASQQLLKQMQNVSTGIQPDLEGTSVALPDFEKYSEASRIVGDHFNKNNIDNVLRRFEQLEKELNLNIPVSNTDDIDDLVENAEAVEFVENQIIEDGVLKPSISQALLGFNLSNLTLTQSGSLVAFGGSVATYLHFVLGELLDENITAARFFTIAIVYFLPVYGAAMVADGAPDNDKDSPAA
ncbi:hypothetical protein ACUY3B_08480 [Corynebacterium ureicelerivorans]